jgi:hypothetical protein
VKQVLGHYDCLGGALANLKHAKMATASDTTLKNASASLPKSLGPNPSGFGSRGMRLNVVAIADHPAATGTTKVSAIPKQYSKGKFKTLDSAEVIAREYTSKRRYLFPIEKQGKVNNTAR